MSLRLYLTRAGIAVLAAGAVTSAVALWNAATNYQTRIETSDTLYLKKMDGVLAHAQIDLSYSRDDIILEATDPFGNGSRKYRDKGRDGSLDNVNIERSLFQVGGTAGSFNYERDASKHPEIFPEENRCYQQHLREFAKQSPQDFKRMGIEKALLPK